jgi:hypothetical protein
MHPEQHLRLGDEGGAARRPWRIGVIGGAFGRLFCDVADAQQAFVASEVNGRWHAAIEVPGTAALNRDDKNPGNASAGVASVSCSQATRCTALGAYTDHSGYEQALVASES